MIAQRKGHRASVVFILITLFRVFTHKNAY